MNDTRVMTPASEKSLDTSPMRRMFSTRAVLTAEAEVLVQAMAHVVSVEQSSCVALAVITTYESETIRSSISAECAVASGYQEPE